MPCCLRKNKKQATNFAHIPCWYVDNSLVSILPPFRYIRSVEIIYYGGEGFV